jgi:predicted double-glycine peptidase
MNQMQKIGNSFGQFLQTAELYLHPDAVVLDGFARAFQFHRTWCGANSLYAILRYFGIHASVNNVARLANTDEDGTEVSNIKKVLRRYRLEYHSMRKPGLRDLKAAIDHGNPILISLYDDYHYSVVYGYSRTHIFVMNPSILPKFLGGCGSLFCAVKKSDFREIWDYWGLVVSR